MNLQPLSILLTIVGGLILAGLLGWIKKPRLVVFVPRLFSHSRISDKGQIAEISIMNRGFKTEENVELSLSPSLHYELVGSNNPDSTLASNKLIVPRIGSGDDCSVLLQVENGKFTHTEIVSCLSKETKATVATKLEDIPVTAQQRVGILMFFGVLVLLPLIFIKGIDYITDKVTATDTATNSASTAPKADTQGWSIGDIYAKKDNALYLALVSRQIAISTSSISTRRNTAIIPIKIENKLPLPITLQVKLISSAEQDPLSFSKNMLPRAVIFPDDSIEKVLEVAVPASPKRRKVIVEFFAESTDGETMSGRKIIDLSES